jgi:hypothetical protein
MVTTLVKNLSFEEYLNYNDGLDFKYELVNDKLELLNKF